MSASDKTESSPAMVCLLAWLAPGPVSVLALALGLAGCPDRPPTGETTGSPTIKAVPAGPAPSQQPRGGVGAESGFIGVVVAGESAELEPRVEGRIEEVFVRAGDTVRRGQPIARLDRKASEHELAIARAALVEASRRLARRAKLARGRAAAVTPEEVDVARRDLLQERARVAKLTEARDEARLVAPFDGTVAERYLSAGALAGPGRAVARLIGPGVPRVRFAIPEDRAGSLAVGTRVTIELVAPGGPLGGEVSGLAAEVDASSRMVYGAATLEEPARRDPRLTTGVIARVFPRASGTR
jgi:RND family efflux transporter MFP subunit